MWLCIHGGTFYLDLKYWRFLELSAPDSPALKSNETNDKLIMNTNWDPESARCEVVLTSYNNLHWHGCLHDKVRGYRNNSWQFNFDTCRGLAWRVVVRWKWRLLMLTFKVNFNELWASSEVNERNPSSLAYVSASQDNRNFTYSILQGGLPIVSSRYISWQDPCSNRILHCKNNEL